MNEIKYRIYPTLLDAFTWMRAAEDEETHAKAERELIDKINRVPVPPTEAASRGTALNEVLDAVIAGTARCDNGYYEVHKDGFRFMFDPFLLDELREWVGDAVPQVYLSATVKTTYGDVEIYGYADYINGDTIIDLKSTTAYTVGKYADNWQHRAYTFCALDSGMVERVRCFEYLVAELNKENPQGGIVFREDYYPADYTDSYLHLRDVLENEFLPWVEMHRSEITDKKIFNNL